MKNANFIIIALLTIFLFGSLKEVHAAYNLIILQRLFSIETVVDADREPAI